MLEYIGSELFSNSVITIVNLRKEKLKIIILRLAHILFTTVNYYQIYETSNLTNCNGVDLMITKCGTLTDHLFLDD